MYKILIVDPDIQMLDIVEQLLNREGYVVYKARSIHDAISVIDDDPPELFIINMALPGSDGLALCRRLRADPSTVETPILFMADASTNYGVADALNAGGDDFLRKPFALRELAARVRAHLRRAKNLSDDMPHLRIVPDNLMVYVNDREVVLTQVEFELLTFLCNSPDELHSTQDLLSDVWRYPAGTGDTALVRNHIRNLRRKLEEDPERPNIIQSRHGRGYTIRAHIQIENQVVGGAV